MARTSVKMLSTLNKHYTVFHTDHRMLKFCPDTFKVHNTQNEAALKMNDTRVRLINSRC